MTELIARHRRLATWIVLGAAALLAVVAIVLAAGVFRQVLIGDATSPSPEPSATVASQEPSAEPSAQVTPTPGEIPVEGCAGWPGCPVEPFAAIVLVDDLLVRADPGLAGTPVDALQTDDVVWILDGPVEADGGDWFNVQGRTNLVGWVSAGPSDNPYLDPYLDLRSHLPVNLPATMTGLAAGADGFLAWGTEARRSDEAPRRVVLFSSDGAVWQGVSLPAAVPPNVVGAAWGSSGWIIITRDPTDTFAGTFWHSDDGLSWTALPAFDGPRIGPMSVVASTTGYVMTDFTGPGPNFFFSVDGQAWRKIDYPRTVLSSGVVPVPNGFLRWATPEVGGSMFTTDLVFSTDGGGWVGTGPSLPRPSLNDPPLFAVAGDRIVAVLADSATGALNIWRSSLPRPTLSWERQTAAEAAVGDTYPTSLVSDGSTLLLVGHDRSDATSRIWRSTDGSSWTAVPAAALFGGVVPSLMAGGDAGFVGGGRVATGAGANPVLWRSADGLGWSGEPDPVLGMLDSLVVGSCPELPHTQVDWLAIPGSVAAECFGDAPITFDGWLTDSGGCGGYYTGVWEPSWLAPPYATYPIILTPFEAATGACGSAAQHPSLAAIPGMQQWVTVTGHYDDPVASTCRWSPDAESGPIVIDAAWLVQSCREKFVATEVVPLTR